MPHNQQLLMQKILDRKKNQDCLERKCVIPIKMDLSIQNLMNQIASIRNGEDTNPSFWL
jgi:uncharacterized Zn-finger protein